MTNVSNSNTSGITMVYLLTRKFPTLSNYYMYYCPYQCEVITNTFPSFTYHNDERYKYLIPFFQPAMETIQPQKAFDRELLLDRKGLFLCFKDNLCDCMTLTCGGCHLLCHSCG